MSERMPVMHTEIPADGSFHSEEKWQRGSLFIQQPMQTEVGRREINRATVLVRVKSVILMLFRKH